MRNLFLPGADLDQPTLTVDGPDAHHLATVLRVRTGELITVLDDRGGAADAEIAEVDRKCVRLSVLGPTAAAPEPSVSITVGQALGKGDKFEQVVQHGTEVGASSFIPLLTERSVVRLDSRGLDDKRARWLVIAKGAAEQSGRCRIPRIERPLSVKDAARDAGAYERVLILDPAGEPLEPVLRIPVHGKATARCPELLLLIGPEGGFSPEEVAAVTAVGGFSVRLGDYVLRTETAALVAIAQILFANRLGLPPKGSS